MLHFVQHECARVPRCQPRSTGLSKCGSRVSLAPGVADETPLVAMALAVNVASYASLAGTTRVGFPGAKPVGRGYRTSLGRSPKASSKARPIWHRADSS
jgi:hypothetical protein